MQTNYFSHQTTWWYVSGLLPFHGLCIAILPSKQLVVVCDLIFGLLFFLIEILDDVNRLLLQSSDFHISKHLPYGGDHIVRASCLAKLIQSRSRGLTGLDPRLQCSSSKSSGRLLPSTDFKAGAFSDETQRVASINFPSIANLKTRDCLKLFFIWLGDAKTSKPRFSAKLRYRGFPPLSCEAHFRSLKDRSGACENESATLLCQLSR